MLEERNCTVQDREGREVETIWEATVIGMKIFIDHMAGISQKVMVTPCMVFINCQTVYTQECQILMPKGAGI